MRSFTIFFNRVLVALILAIVSLIDSDSYMHGQISKNLTVIGVVIGIVIFEVKMHWDKKNSTGSSER